MTKFKFKITNILPEFKFKKIIQVLMIIQYLYGTSFNIYYNKIELNKTLHKEYKLSKNSTLNENF